MDIPSLYHVFLQCDSVTTDSRHCPENSLFFALKGESFDGNEYASQALDKGSRYAVIDNPAYQPAEDTRYIRVDDCLRALQQLAAYHRKQMATPVIGITGTNGKTTTKELIAGVLARRHQVLYTEGNLNNHIGVPLTLLRLRKEHTLAVIEMGANHPGEIRELAEIADPDYGLITNIGKAHLEGFGSLEGVIRTKGELYDYLRKKKGVVFIHQDNPLLRDIAQDLSLVRYGTTQECFVRGEVTGNSPYLSLCWKESAETTTHATTTQLIGAYNFPNALAAITVGIYFGIPAAEVDAALAGYQPANNRSQLIRTAHNLLIMDAYNANPTSMQAALDNFRQMEATRKVVILGDMKELGKESQQEHQKIADLLSSSGFQRVILIGSEFGQVRHPFERFPDVAAFAEYLRQEPLTGSTILIKGSNSTRLTTLANQL
ncbi:MAG: UDP-N-acetylmuramoyl-tripeptide--D-alanyl-D-alanine ligase [Bacteroides sp.]|nr:UDP-N-acetylmuramoyl-tripeptide--D-alanyl-D-alanine ligase [Bacteroides sp.]